MLEGVYRSLFGQLMLAFLVVSAGSFGLNVALTVIAGRGPLEDLVEDNLESLARSVLDEVDVRFDQVAQEVRVWSRLELLDEILIGDRSWRVENLLIDLQRDHAADYESLSIVDADGLVLASTRFEHVGEPWPFELPVLKDEAVGVGRIPEVTDESRRTFFLTHPIRARLRADPIGWMIAEARVEPFRGILERAQEMNTGEIVRFALLYDDEHRLLAGGFPRPPQNALPPAALEATTDGGVEPISLGPLGNYLKATSTRRKAGAAPGGLRVVALWRMKEAQRAARNFVFAAIGAGALGLALAIGASFLIARRLTGPLRVITEGTTRLAAGELEHRVSEDAGSEEIGRLARSFNTMAGRLATAVRSLEVSTARWRAIVTHAPDIVMTIARDGSVLSINRTAPGFTVAQVAGSKVSDHLGVRHAAAFGEAMREVFDQGGAAELEVEAHGEGYPPTWYSLRLGPIRKGEEIVAAACIATDITDKRRLEKQILQVSEEERARIGRDLHDGLGQVLTGTAMLVRGLRQKLDDRGIEAEAADTRRIAGLINDAIDQTRTLAHGLFPVGIGAGGLQAALEEMASSVGGMPGITCQFDSGGSALDIDHVRATHLFRIVQEAVNNALKHADAANIWIRVFNDADRVSVTVLDDGTGIDSAPEGTGGGIGLHLMAYRARLIDASLEIRRRPEGGTEVACWLETSMEGSAS